MGLQGIIESTQAVAPFGIIYGPPGVGKTTFAAYASNSLIIDCENGAGTVKCKRTPYLDDWNDIAKWLKDIETEDHDYDVIAIDSLDWLLRRLEENVSGSKHKLDSTLNKCHGGFGNGKLVLRNYVYQELLPQFNRIVNKGIAIVLLAHSSKQSIIDEEGLTIEKHVPEIHKELINAFIEWANFVCFCTVVEGTRQMTTSPSMNCVAKNRYSLPATLPLDWEVFINEVQKGMKERF